MSSNTPFDFGAPRPSSDQKMSDSNKSGSREPLSLEDDEIQVTPLPAQSCTDEIAASSSGDASSSRRTKVRPVRYRSSNLEITAPELVAQASAEAISATRAIQEANAEAERVRENYRKRRLSEEGNEEIEGDDEESNARKYERRLKMNRNSAAASRVRREAYTKALEAQLVSMEQRFHQTMRNMEMERVKSRQLQALLNVYHGDSVRCGGGTAAVVADHNLGSIGPQVPALDVANEREPLSVNIPATDNATPANQPLGSASRVNPSINADLEDIDANMSLIMSIITEDQLESVSVDNPDETQSNGVDSDRAPTSGIPHGNQEEAGPSNRGVASSDNPASYLGHYFFGNEGFWGETDFRAEVLDYLQDVRATPDRTTVPVPSHFDYDETAIQDVPDDHPDTD